MDQDIRNLLEEKKYAEIQKLLKAGIIRNSNYGYIDQKGRHIGYYKSVHKRWIEDRFANQAQTL